MAEDIATAAVGGGGAETATTVATEMQQQQGQGAPLVSFYVDIVSLVIILSI